MMPSSLDCSHRTRTGSRARAVVVAGAIAVALAGCKKDEPAAETKSDGKTADGKTDSKGGTTATGTGTTATGTGTNPADRPLSPATQIQRGNILAHVAIPNGSGLIGEVSSQLVPAAQAAMVNEQTLRTMAGAGLGERGKLATNLDLSKPMGCALVDTQATTVPIACVVGYTGGAAALATDLGNEGKQADAAGHVAKFTVDGQDIFIDDLGGNAVVTNHGELFEKAKGYLETNILGRAGSLASDIEIVVFPAGLMVRYEAALKPFLDKMKQVTPPPGGAANPFAKAMATYQEKSNERVVQVMKDLDQFTLAFSIEPIGFVVRTAMFPVPGSQLERDTKAQALGAFDSKMVENLPKSSFVVAGFSSNIHKATDSSTFTELKTSFVHAYAEAVGKDPVAVDKAIDDFIVENDAIYGDHSAMAFFHEVGTLGSFAAVTSLESGKTGRDSFKTWSAAFTPESVLGPDASKKVTWSFQMDAANIGGVAVDRWIIEPTEATKAEMRKDGGSDLATWETKLGGLKLVVNRAETADRVVFVLSPGNDDKGVQVVLDALAGTSSLAGDPGLSNILARNSGVSGMFAIDAKGGIDWVKELLPPDKAGQIPPNIGGGLDDFFIASSYADTGSSSGEIVLSQRFIDQLRALAK